MLAMLPLTHILFPFLSLYYLLGELASLLVARIPIHSCPWSADNCPALCLFTNPYTPHISSYNIYIDDINNASCPSQAQLEPLLV